MDPQACFRQYVDAVQQGDFDTAYCCADNYLDWTYKGGFHAKDNGANVVRLDPEQDRYLTVSDGLERWKRI